MNWPGSVDRSQKTEKNKLSRGEVCVAKFIPPSVNGSNNQ